MIGGGIIFIDDKARGLHEGYLVTPIRKLELILGFKPCRHGQSHPSTGLVLVTLGSIIAAYQTPLNIMRLARLHGAGPDDRAGAFISLMFLLMVRVTDPLVPRAIFGMLNTVLFFSERGRFYPIQAFPAWMRVITRWTLSPTRCMGSSN